MNDNYYLYLAVLVFVLLLVGMFFTVQEFKDIDKKE
jgi:hypothetical protein